MYERKPGDTRKKKKNNTQKNKQPTQDQNHRALLGDFKIRNTDMEKYKTNRKIHRSGCQELSNSYSQSASRSSRSLCFLNWLMITWPVNTIEGSHCSSEHINSSISSDVSVCCVYSSTNSCSVLLKPALLPC